MLARKAEGRCNGCEILADRNLKLITILFPLYIHGLRQHLWESRGELKNLGVDYKTGQFPMRALGRARASMHTDGL